MEEAIFMYINSSRAPVHPAYPVNYWLIRIIHPDM